MLYCLFVIEHGRRRIVRFNTTAHPTSEWIVQQLREAFPLPCPQRYVVLDRNAEFGSDVIEFLKASGIKPIRTSIRSPWQNGIAERWIGSCRRETTDHVIPLNERHLKRLANEYLTYYHQDRTHKSSGKQTLGRRPIQSRPAAGSEIQRCRASAAFIIDIAGQEQPDKHCRANLQDFWPGLARDIVNNARRHHLARITRQWTDPTLRVQASHRMAELVFIYTQKPSG